METLSDLEPQIWPPIWLTNITSRDAKHACIRGQKINANLFCTKFFDNPSGHGRPRRQSWTSAPKSAFSCGPVVGRNFLTPGHTGVSSGMSAGNPDQKVYIYAFSSLMYQSQETSCDVIIYVLFFFFLTFGGPNKIISCDGCLLLCMNTAISQPVSWPHSLKQRS